MYEYIYQKEYETYMYSEFCKDSKADVLEYPRWLEAQLADKDRELTRLRGEYKTLWEQYGPKPTPDPILDVKGGPNLQPPPTDTTEGE